MISICITINISHQDVPLPDGLVKAVQFDVHKRTIRIEHRIAVKSMMIRDLDINCDEHGDEI